MTRSRLICPLFYMLVTVLGLGQLDAQENLNSEFSPDSRGGERTTEEELAPSEDEGSEGEAPTRTILLPENLGLSSNHPRIQSGPHQGEPIDTRRYLPVKVYFKD